MEIDHQKVWALITARGDSKSIPLKNMSNLGGKPLVYYVINAAKSSKTLSRLICSTDDERISAYCNEQGVEVHKRPENLSQDDTPVLDVLIHLLRDIVQKEGKVAEIIVLLQPTSPFLLPNHIDECVQLLFDKPTAQSSQTISKIPHNFHAYNQRVIEDGWLKFRFPEERKFCYNKQKKPTFYIYGNLIVTRSKTLLEDGEIFGARSLPLLIPFFYSLDVDGPEDLEMAELYIKEGKINLNF
jgi:CMP-N,N'-diacetyllegionaminic acid synthase